MMNDSHGPGQPAPREGLCPGCANGGKEVVVDFPRLDVASSEGKGQGLVGAYNISKTATGARLKLALNNEAVVDRRFLLVWTYRGRPVPELVARQHAVISHGLCGPCLGHFYPTSGA